jgi:AcrR family transcriptional regulator
MSITVITRYNSSMGRWKPDARARLEEAALELFAERGFAQSTAAEIAARAGLTERTFFRHFADKREVLFSGSGALRDRLLTALATAPPSLPAIDAVAVAVEAAVSLLQTRREHARRRQAVVVANPELQERERVKLATLASALAGGLRQRGVNDSTATLAAEMGIAVFRIAFERWINEPQALDLPRVARESFRELKLIARERSRAKAVVK